MDLDKKLVKAEQLINNKKYIKAKDILKKINAKHKSANSVFLEAVCFFNLGNFEASKSSFSNVLKFNINDKLTLTTLDNLATCHIQLEEIVQSLNCYEKIFENRPAAQTKSFRTKGCKLAHKYNEHSFIFAHAPKLLGFVEEANFALLALQSSSIAIGDFDSFNKYFKKQISEANSLSQRDMLQLIKLYRRLENKTPLLKLLETTHTKFHHLDWYIKELNAIKNQSTSPKPQPPMPQNKIIGDDKALIKKIEELVEYSKSKGAYFNDKLRIYCDKGELSIKSFNQHEELLMKIPVTCMPLLNDYDIQIKDSKLLVAPKQTQLNPEANKTMSLMIDIYNYSKKIINWGESNPFIALKGHKGLLKKLVNSKSKTVKTQMFLALEGDELLLETFLSSRTFTYTKETLESVGIHSNQDQLGLLSIIDFLNHKSGSSNYTRSKETIEITSLPDQVSNEVFVEYNLIDPIQTYLIYNFIDPKPSFLYSIETEIQLLNNEKIKVEAISGTLKRELIDPSFEHAAQYMPFVAKTKEGWTISKLQIPLSDSNLNMLKDPLIIILKEIRPSINDVELIAEMENLSKQLILNNLKFCNELEQELDSAIASPKGLNEQCAADIRLLINTLKNGLYRYANKNGFLLF